MISFWDGSVDLEALAMVGKGNWRKWWLPLPRLQMFSSPKLERKLGPVDKDV